jgi:hypothetical protein
MLIRDPVQQWLSFYSLRRRPRPTYFELCHYVLLSEMAGCAEAGARTIWVATSTAKAIWPSAWPPSAVI